MQHIYGDITAQFHVAGCFSGLDFQNGHFIAELNGQRTILGHMPDPDFGWYAGIDSVMVCEKYLELGRTLTAAECLEITK